MSSRAPSSGIRKTVLLVGLLALVTGGHWFVQDALAGGKPLYMSKIEPGERVVGLAAIEASDLRESGVTRLLGDARCEVVVVYAPTCPFCHEAALKESRREEGLALPTTWVAEIDDEGAREFTELVHSESRVVFHEDIKKILEVQAFPAGFLVRDGEEILDTWPYRGNESPERFEELCERPTSV